jgi:hypothetical protein
MLCRRLDEIASAWRAATAEPPIVSVNNPNPSARLTHAIRASPRQCASRDSARRYDEANAFLQPSGMDMQPDRSLHTRRAHEPP